MKRTSFALPALLLTGILGSLSPPTPARAQSDEVRVRVRLTGAAIEGIRPSGHVEFRSRDDRQTFKAEVEDVNLPDDTTLSVNINGNPVASLTLDEGFAERELVSRKGDTIPVLQEGDVVTVTDAGGMVILSGASPAPRVLLKARLTGPAIDGLTPKGLARFRSRGARMDFKVQVERVKLADGTVLTVKLNGAVVGTLTLNLRRGALELNTQDGHTVPAVQAGDAVTVTDADGNVLLSGTF